MELVGKKDGARRGSFCQAERLLECQRAARWRIAPLALALFATIAASPVAATAGDPPRQEGDPSPFRKVGGGACLAPASRDVRGRSRRDLSHPACRGLCGSSCIGYTYAPCEKVCTLHGDPSQLNNTEEADGWTTVNGGGKIDTSSGRCGSNCYVRMGPCAAGSVSSNGATVTHVAMPYAAARTAVCPNPFVGTLQMRCTLDGAIVEAGRCRSPCPPGVVVDGNFEVAYPQILHGLEAASSCPQGANGNITMACLDGQASRVAGRCGYNCVAGSLRVGDAAVPYPFMVHEQVLTLKCPNSTSGTVRLECVDSRLYVVHGMCKANCVEDDLPLAIGSPSGFVTYGAIHYPDLNNTDEIELPCAPPLNFTNNVTLRCYRGSVTIIEGYCRRHCLEGSIGPGVKAVRRPRMMDMSQVTVQCNSGFVGELDLECDDGNVTLLQGECMMHCAANTITTNSLTIPHPDMDHNTTVNVTCPAGYTGTIAIHCFDGYRTFEGVCGKNCPAGFVMSNTAKVFHIPLNSGTTMNFSCPEGPFLENGLYTPTYIGVLTIRCYDGSVRHDAGWCGKPCPSGQKEQNGAKVNFPGMNHTQAIAFPCISLYPNSLTFSGNLTVTCWDSTTDYTGECNADCSQGGKLRWMGAQVLYPPLLNLEERPVPCEPSAMYGTVLVTCQTGFGQITGGTCGIPCEESTYAGGLTSYTDTDHPRIGHDSTMWVICPSHLSGTVELSCFNGIVKAVNGSCGERCPASNMQVYGASFMTPLMEHRGVLVTDCQGGYNGIVTVRCDYGRIQADSGCKRPCDPGVMNLPIGGATLTYEAMANADTSRLTCPEGFVGEVVLICNDGNVEVDSGGCYEHCAADWFWDPYHTITWSTSWSVQHYEILHDTVQARDCPEGYSGSIILYCWSGTVSLQSGDCFQDCAPGRAFIRAGVIVRYMTTPNGAAGPRTPCPAGFDGNVRLRCTEGVMALDEGGCNRTCPMSIIATAPHGELGDAEEATLACPDTGTLDVRCNDGKVSVLGGRCIHRCQPGTVTDGNGTVIQHGEIAHNETGGGACIGYATGIVTLYCNDTEVTIQPRAGEQCFRHCRAGPVHTADGQVIMAPDTEHGNRNSAKCPEGRVGIITVRCFDSILMVYDGSCGPANCPAGEVYSNNAFIYHGEINDGWKAGPYRCEPPYSGDATTICRNGTTEVWDVSQQVPATLEDLENTSNKLETLFELCGCCYSSSEPPAVGPIKGEDRGIRWEWAIVGGVAGILAAVSAGCYFLPRRKKTSRVVPEGELSPNDPAVRDFMNELSESLMLQKKVLQKLQALPAPEPQQLLSRMLEDPQVVVAHFDLAALQDMGISPRSQLRAIADAGPPGQLAIGNA